MRFLVVYRSSVRRGRQALVRVSISRAHWFSPCVAQRGMQSSIIVSRTLLLALLVVAPFCTLAAPVSPLRFGDDIPGEEYAYLAVRQQQAHKALQRMLNMTFPIEDVPRIAIVSADTCSCMPTTCIVSVLFFLFACVIHVQVHSCCLFFFSCFYALSWCSRSVFITSLTVELIVICL